MKILFSIIALTTTATFSLLSFGSSNERKIDEKVKEFITEAAEEGLPSAAEQIPRLDLSGLGLSRIDSVSRLTGLEDLNLSSNQIEDLGPLRGLKKLVVLDLSNNRITNLIPLRGLQKLQYLHLGHNQIKSLNQLLALPELTGLDLTGNNDLEFEGLKTMSSLQFLFLTPGPNLSQQEVDSIKKALPDCTVTLVSVSN